MYFEKPTVSFEGGRRGGKGRGKGRKRMVGGGGEREEKSDKEKVVSLTVLIRVLLPQYRMPFRLVRLSWAMQVMDFQWTKMLLMILVVERMLLSSTLPFELTPCWQRHRRRKWAGLQSWEQLLSESVPYRMVVEVLMIHTTQNNGLTIVSFYVVVTVVLCHHNFNYLLPNLAAVVSVLLISCVPWFSHDILITSVNFLWWNCFCRSHCVVVNSSF